MALNDHFSSFTRPAARGKAVHLGHSIHQERTVNHPSRVLGDHQIRRSSRGYLNVPSLQSTLEANKYHLNLRATRFPGLGNEEDENNYLRLSNNSSTDVSLRLGVEYGFG